MIGVEHIRGESRQKYGIEEHKIFIYVNTYTYTHF